MKGSVFSFLRCLPSSQGYFWFAVGMFVIFIGVFILYVRAEKGIDRANERRFHSFLLADELRQSSDDLTRMVRFYVVTGNPLYKRHYEEILAVRDGRSPRPVDAGNVYWDLVLDDDARPRPAGPAVPLMELMRRAGITDEEFAKLAQAKGNSDALTRTEYAAMALIESAAPGDAAAKAAATTMLYDAAYRKAKAGIMRPIGEFLDMLEHRTALAVEAAKRDAVCMRWIVVLAGAVLVAALGGLLVSIYRENQARSRSEALLRAVFDNTAVGLAQTDPQGRFLNVNQVYCGIVGFSKDELVTAGADVGKVTFPADVEADRDMMRRLLEGKSEIEHFTKRYLRQDGRVVWGELFVHLLRDDRGNPHSFINAVVDISEKKRTEAELEKYRLHLEELVAERTAELGRRNNELHREVLAHEKTVAALLESERRFRFIAENTCDVIWMMDLKTGRFTYVSPSVFRLRGYTPAEVMAQPVDTAVTPASAEHLRAVLAETIAKWKEGESVNTMRVSEVDQPHKDGHIVHTEVVTSLHADASGEPAAVLGVSRDITERKNAERIIHRMAFYDSLTQLPNRRLLLDRLAQALARANREKKRLALLFMDLDNFKPVNDEFGHFVGDWLLQGIAARILECVRPYDTAARIGGDEFVILLPDVGELREARVVAERIRHAISRPFTTQEGVRLDISSSIGVVLFPDVAHNERDLLRLGDDAMYQAKRAGRNRIVVSGEPSPVAPGHETAPRRIGGHPPPG